MSHIALDGAVVVVGVSATVATMYVDGVANDDNVNDDDDDNIDDNGDSPDDIVGMGEEGRGQCETSG